MNRYNDYSRDVAPEQIIADFQARQASPAYQEMLVSINVYSLHYFCSH